MENVCSYELNTTFNASLQACFESAKKFRADFKSCFDKNQKDPCTCINIIDKENFEKMKDCNTKSANDDAKEKKNACIKGI